MKPHRILLFVLLLLGSGGTAWAQFPTLQWQKQLGIRNQREAGFAILHTRHNRLLVGGNVINGNTSDLAACWLLSNRGDSLRTNTYLQTAVLNAGARVTALDEAPNGDFLLLGDCFTNVSGQVTNQHFLLRTDSLGVQRWVQFYNTGAAVEALSCLALPDGGALLMVNRNHPSATRGIPIRVATVIRVDSLGSQVWLRSYGQPHDSFEHIIAVPDGSYAIVGTKVVYQTNPAQANGAPWLVRLNLDGDTLRTRVLTIPQTSSYGYGLCLTPAGTLTLVGTVGFPAQPSLPSQGLLLELDAQDRLARYHLVVAPRPTQNNGCWLYRAYALPAPGQYVVAGINSGPNINAGEGYLARYEFQPGGGATPAWQVQFLKFDIYQRPNTYLLQADHTLTVADWGNYRTYNGNRDVLVQRFAGLPPVYAPDLCAVPPVPNAAYAVPPAAPDSLNLLELGSGGPPHAELLHWRWELGDGTVVERTAPGWVRHRYAQVPAYGTAVRVRVTNNLGCTATQVLYPWGGQPTATQQAQQAARALAAGASVFPNPVAGGDVVHVRLPDLRAQGPVRAGVAEAGLDAAGWPAGVYTVQLHPLEGPVTKRLVKE